MLDHPVLPFRHCRSRPRPACFNPCCVGSPSPSGLERRLNLILFLFQSLLCWITQSFLPLARPDQKGWERVSIPVVLDHPVLLRPECRCRGRQRVSIPVVLDHPVLPHGSPSGFRRRRPGFNPCCVGSPSPSSSTVRPPWRRGRGFNPCCVGSPSPSSCPPPYCPPGSLRFNPCCVGSPSPSAGGKVPPPADQRGFNPCCVGSPSPSSCPPPYCPPGSLRFNPCCVGSPSPSPRPSWRGRSSPGFNPCCVGSPSPSGSTTPGKTVLTLEFQSLLCWITQSFDPAPVGRLRPRRVSIPVVLDHPVLLDEQMDGEPAAEGFQSLLCWITQSFSASPLPLPLAFECFNPCCVGSPSPSGVDRGLGRRRSPVSIPVVLDHPVLLRVAQAHQPAGGRVSIPVVLDHPVLPISSPLLPP